MPPLKDLLGKPGEGVHFHVFGVAIVDAALTLAAGCSIGWLLSRNSDPLSIACIMTVTTTALFLLGQALHALIGVETAVIIWVRRHLDGE